MNVVVSDDLAPVREWILTKRPEAADLDEHVDLIDNRIIDSLDFMELIFLLEEITATEFDLNTLSINSFRSLHAIRKNFLEQGEPK